MCSGQGIGRLLPSAAAASVLKPILALHERAGSAADQSLPISQATLQSFVLGSRSLVSSKAAAEVAVSSCTYLYCEKRLSYLVKS